MIEGTNGQTAGRGKVGGRENGRADRVGEV